MAIIVLVFAYLAILYLLIIVYTLHRGAPRFGTDRGRRPAVSTSPQGQERKLALKEGETIVGVGETTTTICFYIGIEMMENKSDECEDA